MAPGASGLIFKAAGILGLGYGAEPENKKKRQDEHAHGCKISDPKDGCKVLRTGREIGIEGRWDEAGRSGEGSKSFGDYKEVPVALWAVPGLLGSPLTKMLTRR